MFLKDLELILVEENILNADTVLMGTGASVPTGDGVFVSFIQTGGSSFARTHDSKYEQPGAQVTVRSDDFVLAMTLAMVIHAVLDNVTNRVVGDTWYKTIRATQMPADAGLDDSKRPQVKFNVTSEKLPEGEN